jgi:hypothetical protein
MLFLLASDISTAKTGYLLSEAIAAESLPEPAPRSAMQALDKLFFKISFSVNAAMNLENGGETSTRVL